MRVRPAVSGFQPPLFQSGPGRGEPWCRGGPGGDLPQSGKRWEFSNFCSRLRWRVVAHSPKFAREYSRLPWPPCPPRHRRKASEICPLGIRGRHDVPGRRSRGCCRRSRPRSTARWLRRSRQRGSRDGCAPRTPRQSRRRSYGSCPSSRIWRQYPPLSPAS